MASATLNKILSKVNLNTIVASLCGVIIVFLQMANHSETLDKVKESEQKTDVVQAKQWKNSGRMDTLIMQQKILLHNDSLILEKLGL